MKTPKKNPKKPAASKGTPSSEPRKTKLKPISSKSKKNWKNRILEEDDEDFEMAFDDDLDPFDDLDDFDDREDYDRY